MRRQLLATVPAIGILAIVLWASFGDRDDGGDDRPALLPAGSSCSDAMARYDSETGGSLDFRGDFENGTSGWEEVQSVAADRVTAVDSPVAQGRSAGRFETRPSDTIGDTDPRSEVYARVGAVEGAEQYYRWFTLFPEDLPTDPSEFLTFAQWRAVDESDSFTSFMVWGDKIQLRRNGIRWSAPLERDAWHKFVYHVKWSPDPEVGFIELCYDDRLVLPRTYLQTMAGTPGDGVENYLKQGLYKSPDLPTGVIFHDGLLAGSSYRAVGGDDRPSGTP